MTAPFSKPDTSLMERKRDHYAMLARDLLMMGNGVEAMKMQAHAAQYRDWVNAINKGKKA